MKISMSTTTTMVPYAVNGVIVSRQLGCSRRTSPVVEQSTHLAARRYNNAYDTGNDTVNARELSNTAEEDCYGQGFSCYVLSLASSGKGLEQSKSGLRPKRTLLTSGKLRYTTKLEADSVSRTGVCHLSKKCFLLPHNLPLPSYIDTFDRRVPVQKEQKPMY